MGWHYTTPPASSPELPAAADGTVECDWIEVEFPSGITPGDDIDDPLEVSNL